MMRFILTVVIWVVIVGGLWTYSRQREIAEAGIVREKPVITAIEEKYTLRLTPTFSVEKDPFALQVEGETGMGVDLRLNGSPVEVAADSLQRGIPWVLESVDGLVVGHNEIYLQASPPLVESEREHGVRVQLVKGGQAVVDRTVWGEQGALVSGTIHFELHTTGDNHER